MGFRVEFREPRIQSHYTPNRKPEPYTDLNPKPSLKSVLFVHLVGGPLEVQQVGSEAIPGAMA